MPSLSVRFFPNKPKPKDVNNKTLSGSRARIKEKNENRRLFSGQAKRIENGFIFPKNGKLDSGSKWSRLRVWAQDSDLRLHLRLGFTLFLEGDIPGARANR
ncbi:hypothetical protein DdX_09312 [Ditylenchus destructor]|uniref:Uncharacterized protein n=1 Tax=Ditylenchus destructor TaxID=166010 RepID=A0AAD4N342_9BILA|nr:hypothetical protein DdX_09312 [Ditylenchus destructor]